jgi:5'(3')-deoxyribonucleotidase
MKRVFIDMDNVLVDFQSGLDQVSEEIKVEYAGRLDEIPGLFGLMKPMEGAIEAVHELQKHYDLFILSTAPWKNPSAWSDKVEWVTKYLDDVFHKKMVITHRKDLCQGDYMIDDNGKNGTSEFAGEWIQFGSEQFPNWESVLQYLLSKEKKQSLDDLLNEIGRTPLITYEEELELLKAVQEKGTDREEMRKLEKANMRFVVSMANQYQKQGLTLEELIEAGTEGLRKAAVKYDLNVDIKFIAYAVWWIRQSIIQTIESNKKYISNHIINKTIWNRKVRKRERLKSEPRLLSWMLM